MGLPASSRQQEFQNEKGSRLQTPINAAEGVVFTSGRVQLVAHPELGRNQGAPMQKGITKTLITSRPTLVVAVQCKNGLGEARHSKIRDLSR